MPTYKYIGAEIFKIEIFTSILDLCLPRQLFTATEYTASLALTYERNPAVERHTRVGA